MSYAYGQRKQGSCQGKQPARGSETGLSVANAEALFTRPKMFHSGPDVWRGQEGETRFCPWGWTRIDQSNAHLQTLDRATYFPETGDVLIDYRARLILTTVMNTLGDRPPQELGSSVPLRLILELMVFDSGTTPSVVSSVEVDQVLSAYPEVSAEGGYPLLSTLFFINRSDAVQYNADLVDTGYQGVKLGQTHAQDEPFIQDVSLQLRVSAADWLGGFAVARNRPHILRLRALKTTGATVGFHPLVSAAGVNYPARNFRTDPFVRVFCISSTAYTRGVL